MVQKQTTRLCWDDLEAIMLVGRFGSVRKAAESIGVAHTTLAKRVENAERILGVVAFVRSAKGHVTTKAGRSIVAHAERMAREANALVRHVSGTDDSVSGRVCISLLPLVLANIIRPHLGKLSGRYPKLVLEFDTNYRLSDLDKQRADVVIRFQDKPVDHLYGRRVGTMHDAVYASLELARWIGESADEVPLIGWSHSTRVTQRAAEHGFTNTRIRYIAEDIQTQRDLAISGEGIAVLPCFVGDPEQSLLRVSQGKTRPINDVWVLTHPDHKESARVQAVARFCADTIKRETGLLTGALA